MCVILTVIFARFGHEKRKNTSNSSRRNVLCTLTYSYTVRDNKFRQIHHFLFLYLTVDGPQRATLPLAPQRFHPACGHEGSFHLSPVLAYELLSRCKFSSLTSRQPMVKFYFLTLFATKDRKRIPISSRMELTTSALDY